MSPTGNHYPPHLKKYSSMEKIHLGGYVVRTAKSLKRKIDSVDYNDLSGSQMCIYWQCVGIYDTRLLGLVFYRNSDHKINRLTNKK